MFDPKPLQDEIAALGANVAKLTDVPAFDSKPLEARIAALQGDVTKLKSEPTMKNCV